LGRTGGREKEVDLANRQRMAGCQIRNAGHEEAGSVPVGGREAVTACRNQFAAICRNSLDLPLTEAAGSRSVTAS
jgi:hypothetical protein